jgi:RNA polymerase sigma-70 factor (ECF subfamily)
MLTDAEITAAYEEGMRSWPTLSVAPARFAHMLRDVDVTSDGLRQWPGDVYLACAAAGGDREAIRVIDEHFVARLPARIRRLGARPENVADILQVVRERLFSGAAPRIRAYNARGPLKQWISVVAIRTAVDLHRRETAAPRAESAWLETIAGPHPDVTALMMTAEVKHELEAAIREQVAALSPRDRAILRLHVIENVSLERIAPIYGVHRITVARWVWAAGERVLDGLRRRFQQRFGIVPPELESMARLARSQLSLNLAELLVD